MVDERWERIKSILEKARELPEAQRAAFLDRECGGDASLRAEVESLLPEVGPGDTFLISPDLEPLIPPGRVLGDFELLHELGHGASGVVYSALQRSLRRYVAVKVLKTLGTTETGIERFHREALSAAKMQHPGIVQVYSSGQEGDTHWFAMEYVPGRDLNRELVIQREVLEARQREEPTSEDLYLPPHNERGYIAAAARLAADIADALQFAHDREIVHRDVKPHNVLLRPDGRAQLADFGIARDESMGRMTVTGHEPGTPHYMSPEQARAHQACVDHRTDIYSLGVVLYEMLTLKTPFEGSTSEEVLAKVRTGEPRSVRSLNPRVPRDLAAVCHAAMRKDVEDRYSTAGELAAALRRFLAHEAVLVPRPSLWRRVRGFGYRYRLAGGGLALILAAVTISLWFAAKQARETTVTALREPLQSLAAAPDWGDVEIEQLSVARNNLAEIAELGATTELEDQLASRFDAVLEDWKQRGLADLEAGLGDRVGNDAVEIDDAQVLNGLFRLHRTAMLFPEDPEVRDLVSIDTFSPRLTVRILREDGQPASGRVLLRARDPASGMPGGPVPLGSLPLEEAIVPPGIYRIVAELDAGGFREFSRILRRGRNHEIIEGRIDPRHASTDGMRLIDGGELAIPATGTVCSNEGRRIQVPSFWIDECEVSVAEYRVFLVETNRLPPWGWAQLEGRPEYDDLPVVYVSGNDAQAYAEWAGKRLLAHAEWEWAARGATARRFPWTDDPEVDVYLGNTNRAWEPSRGVEGNMEVYFRSAEPVRSHEDARTPEGVFHMLGNVWEWTESVLVENVDGRSRVRTDRRIALGDSWYAASRGGSLGWHEEQSPDRNYASYTRGFRCGRSIQP